MTEITGLEWALRGAGVVLLGIASANFFAPRMLAYGPNLARVSPIVRQIFWVHAVYVVLGLVVVAGLCLFLPATLPGSYLAACLALLAALRLGIQLFVYDRAERRARRAADVVFLVAFAYLTVAFGAAALW